MRRPLTAALLLLQAGLWAQDLPALAAPAAGLAPAAATVEKDPAEGLKLSIRSNAQGNFGKLGIGVGFVGTGNYLDEKGARRYGPYASLSIAVAGAPDQSVQPDVREGQTLIVADYRIAIDKLVPASSGEGTVLLRVWAPPTPPAKASKGWRRFFGL